MIIKILAEGGNMKPGPAISQQLGPAGINLGQVIQKVNDATKNFNGLTVPVIIDVNTKNKTFIIAVSSPPVSELLKKELGITKGSGEQKKFYAANASIEQIISVAKQKHSHMLAKDLKKAVKTVAGTCASLGVFIENMPASEIGNEIDRGKFKKEIEEERTITPKEKKDELDKFFSDIHAKQEKLKKQEEAAKAAAEEEKKTAATPAAIPATVKESKPEKK